MSLPRIPPLILAEIDPKARELLDRVTLPARGGVTANVFTTLVRHPGLFRRWLGFGSKLLMTGLLPARDREIMILRTAWLTRSEYEWGQHVRLARAAGMSDAEIEDVCRGTMVNAFESVLVRAVDELQDTAVLSDATWKALADRYDERQLIEVPMLIGQYSMLAFTLNSLGVPLDEGVEGFPWDPPSG